MIKIAITYERENDDSEISVELEDENYSLENLFAGFENCLSEAGFDDVDIAAYYIGRMSENLNN